MTNNVLKKFINTHLVYPPEALQNNEQGVVKIEYYIDKEGHITSKKVVSSVSPQIDSSALHLFDLILWKPAYYYGKPREGQGEFKIKYNVGRYESLVKKRGYDQLPEPFENIDGSGKIFTLKNLDFAPEANLDSIYSSVQDFIVKNLEYPEAAAKLSIAGDVKLRLVIETSGLPSNIMIMEAVGGGCTEEAIRIVQQLKWIPGVKDDLAVRTCYDISIRFDPADQLKNKHIPSQTNTSM
jgi:TonB family protein